MGIGNEENELVIIKAKEIQLFQNEESKQSYTFLCWRHVAKQAAKKNAGDFLCVQFRADTGDPFRGIAERFPRSGKFLSGPGQSLIYAPIMNKYYEKNVCSCVLEFWTRLDGLRYEICSYSNHMAAKAAAKIDLKDSVLCFMTTHNGVWKIDFIGMILCFSIFAFAMIWSNIGGADALIAGVIGYNLGLYGLYAIILALCICIPYLLYMHVKHKEHDYPFVPFLTVGYFIVYFISEKAGL